VSVTQCLYLRQCVIQVAIEQKHDKGCQEQSGSVGRGRKLITEELNVIEKEDENIASNPAVSSIFQLIVWALWSHSVKGAFFEVSDDDDDDHYSLVRKAKFCLQDC